MCTAVRKFSIHKVDAEPSVCSVLLEMDLSKIDIVLSYPSFIY